MHPNIKSYKKIYEILKGNNLRIFNFQNRCSRNDFVNSFTNRKSHHLLTKYTLSVNVIQYILTPKLITRILGKLADTQVINLLSTCISNRTKTYLLYDCLNDKLNRCLNNV